MRACLIALIGFFFVMISIIRWFEQITEAVDQRQWSKVTTLLVMPLTVWFFPSKVAAGRPTPVPHHEPVRGFGGTVPMMPADAPKTAAPAMPPPKKRAKSAVDPAAIAKLKQKMREQGMLDDKDGE